MSKKSSVTDLLNDLHAEVHDLSRYCGTSISDIMTQALVAFKPRNMEDMTEDRLIVSAKYTGF